MADVGESGFLGEVPRVAQIPDNEWGRLALHLASMHADPMAPQRGLRENRDHHGHEHDGPGTIRNHDRESLHFDLDRARYVILEMMGEEYRSTSPGRRAYERYRSQHRPGEPAAPIWRELTAERQRAWNDIGRAARE